MNGTEFPTCGLAFTDLSQASIHALINGLWHHFPENMFLIRVEGYRRFRVAATNPAQAELLSTTPEALAGKRLEEVMPAPEVDAVIGNYQRCVESGEPTRYEEKGVYQDSEGRFYDGYWLTLLVPLANSQGEVDTLFGISQNITRLHDVQNALIRQNRRLERRVAERTAELEQVNQQLQRLAARDPLTDTYNRRTLSSLAEGEFTRAQRYGTPLSVIMLDIDEFKQFNEIHGHAYGDRVLVDTIGAVRQALRTNDILARFGGDEFVVLLPETPLPAALQAAERYRSLVAASGHCTISLGIAEQRADDREVSQLIERADAALRQSKRQGRDQASEH
ncbi:sensor domain-containing diguanylate cyclase [Marinimicrobium alkaliphilum]|uniref:sensor domain-containing diguanylate cyclase n=1 Tax=Marinimicrobium alkaliphilum TaxID=2202654 RepID=UPI000DBA2499|nr:GGDEF domain-containing protein [Marinimicrobium alkaliphilum]